MFIAGKNPCHGREKSSQMPNLYVYQKERYRSDLRFVASWGGKKQNPKAALNGMNSSITRACG